MAANRSKVRDPRWWAKWRAAGAVRWDARRPPPFATVGEARALAGLPSLRDMFALFCAGVLTPLVQATFDPDLEVVPT